MENSRYWRQLDLCPPDKLASPITVIGAGAIGSAAVVTLAKMGCSDITVWDEDVLAEHNVPNQMCLVDRVGQPKVDALAELVRRAPPCLRKIARAFSYESGRSSNVRTSWIETTPDINIW